jgi:hypothetical protein
LVLRHPLSFLGLAENRSTECRVIHRSIAEGFSD